MVSSSVSQCPFFLLLSQGFHTGDYSTDFSLKVSLLELLAVPCETSVSTRWSNSMKSLKEKVQEVFRDRCVNLTTNYLTPLIVAARIACDKTRLSHHATLLKKEPRRHAADVRVVHSLNLRALGFRSSAPRRVLMRW